MESIASFVTRLGLRMEAKRLTDRTDRITGWGPGASHWALGIHRDGFPSMYLQYSMGSAHTKPPTIEDVMDCLVKDVEAVDQSFDDWCGEFGYDSDPRKAKRIYRAIHKQREALLDLIEDAELDNLINNVERL